MASLHARAGRVAFALLLGMLLAAAAAAPSLAHGGYGGAYHAQTYHAASARVVYVSIANLAYHPASLRVRRDTTIVWTNYDQMPHTVTFNNGMADSGVIYPGQRVWFTFTRTGTFGYHCRIHPFMHGHVTVV